MQDCQQLTETTHVYYWTALYITPQKNTNPADIRLLFRRVKKHTHIQSLSGSLPLWMLVDAVFSSTFGKRAQKATHGIVTLGRDSSGKNFI